jgi:exo-beta-1,3-glucanase (GH17 family)
MIFQLCLVLILQLIAAAPLPAITRYHTAPAVVVTTTITSGTSTTWLPPVEIFISNGVTYTFTMTNAPNQNKNAAPTTITSIYNDPVPTTTTQAAAPAENQPNQNTENANTPATTTANAAPATTNANTPATTSTGTTTQQGETTQNNGNVVIVSTSLVTEVLVNGTPVGTTLTTTYSSVATTSSTSTTTNAPTETSGSENSPSAPLDGSLAAPVYLVYSPYQNDGACKDYDTVSSDINYIHSKGINNLRIYGSDCNVFETVLPVVKSLGMKVNQGFWFNYGESADSIDSGVQAFISYGLQNGWDMIDFVTVGNEAINDKVLTVSELSNKIASVKSQLKAAGYNGRVTTSEPPISFIRNPELCTNSEIDFVGINPHSYFDQDVDASQSGSFVSQQKSQVEGVCGGKSVFITETGYPSKGKTNGKNVPTPDNQKIALQSIFSACGTDVTILTAFDDFWKQPGPYGIEQYFGALYLLE